MADSRRAVRSTAVRTSSNRAYSSGGAYSARYDRSASVIERGTSSRSGRVTDEYVYGNTARALQPVEELKSPRELKRKNRKNIDRDTGMNPGFMFFLTLAMAITGFVCIQYIKLQSNVTGYVDTISAMEIQLQEIKASNDDYESRIKGAIGLENIKKHAMDDLGMSYASDEQIVVYESDGTDYVRQFVSLE